MLLVNPFEALQQDDARKRQVTENSSRHARYYSRLETTGFGEIVVKEPVMFDCVFIEQPYVATGWSIGLDQLESGDFPSVDVGVFHWTRDVHGFYKGANLAFRVEGVGPDFPLVHDITFSGVAYKALPDYLLDL